MFPGFSSIKEQSGLWTKLSGTLVVWPHNHHVNADKAMSTALAYSRGVPARL